ncbi:hypothetical protein GCM10009103_54360 [Pseudomonas koreensis]|nr:hypothetical protein GCM10009103_54360 [Pseudomonas koreensis]
MQWGVDVEKDFGRQLGKTSAPIQGLCIRRGFFCNRQNAKSPDMIGAFSLARRKREGDSKGCGNTQGRRQIADSACKPAKALTARASGTEPSRKSNGLADVERMQMWKMQQTSRPGG